MLEKKLNMARYILLGEYHGAKQNLDVLKELLSLFRKQKKPVAILLEWPAILNPVLSPIGKHDIKKMIAQEFHYGSFFRDGRFSREHARFLLWLQKLNKQSPPQQRIRIYAFDTRKHSSQAERDRNMSIEIKRISQTISKHAKIVIVIGNIHASKTLVSLSKHDKPFKPAGAFLSKRKTFSLNIDYAKGSIMNSKKKSIQIIKKKSTIRFIPQKTPAYDYTITLPTADPVTLYTT